MPSDRSPGCRGASRQSLGRGIPQAAPYARRAQPADCVGAPPTGQCLDLILVGQGQKGSTWATPQAHVADCALGVHGAKRYRPLVAAGFRNGCGLVVSISGLIGGPGRAEEAGPSPLSPSACGLPAGARFDRLVLEGSPDAGRAHPADCVGAPPTGQCLDLFLIGQCEK
jgi:hypothetical protein